MHRCQARGLKAVTLYSSKPKKKKKPVWSRGRAINRPRAVQMQNSFRMACSKNSMVHSRASGVLQHMPPIQTPALLPVLNGTQQGLAASRAGSHDLEWGNSCQLLAQSFAAGANNPTTCRGKSHLPQVGKISAQSQHLLPPTELLSTHLTTDSGKENRTWHTILQGTLDLN